MLALLDEVGAANVGGQHGLFDQFVRIVAHTRHDLLDAAAFIAHDLGFGGFKVHRTAHLARCQQGPIHIVQVQQVLHTVLAAYRLRSPGVGQDRCHFGVGETRMAVHDGWIELVGMDIALGRDQHVADHAQAIHVRIERTQPVRKLFRQHRDHPARKVHAGSSVVGIDIDGAAGLHIVAHIRNGHQESPAVAASHLGGRAIDSIVKVTGIFTVDRDQRYIPQVHTAFAVLRAHLVWQSLGLLQTSF